MEVPGLDLLDVLQGVENAIIVDAVEGRWAAGAVQDIVLADLESFSAGSKSAHGWGVVETLRLGDALNPNFAAMEVSVIGIEGAQYALGAGMSPAVREALPRASAAIQKQVERALGA